MKSLFASIADHIGPQGRCIAIVGSGGKTSLMVGLASHYALQGESVLLTTTTKLRKPASTDYRCDHYYTSSAILSSRPERYERIFYALEGEHKALAPPMEELRQLCERFSVTLVEADGARGKDLKIHSERDPVIPPFATATIALLSLSALGKRAGDVCFGCEEEEAIVDLPYLERYITHPEGPLKGVTGRYILLCNQGEGVDQTVIDQLKRTCSHLPIIVGSVLRDEIY